MGDQDQSTELQELYQILSKELKELRRSSIDSRDILEIFKDVSNQLKRQEKNQEVIVGASNLSLDIVEHVSKRDEKLRTFILDEVRKVYESIENHASLCQKNQHDYRKTLKADIQKDVRRDIVEIVKTNIDIYIKKLLEHIGLGVKISFWVVVVVATIFGIKVIGNFMGYF